MAESSLRPADVAPISHQVQHRVETIQKISSITGRLRTTFRITLSCSVCGMEFEMPKNSLFSDIPSYEKERFGGVCPQAAINSSVLRGWIRIPLEYPETPTFKDLAQFMMKGIK